MRDHVRFTLERLGPGDHITHERLCELVGRLPDTLRELDVPLEPVRRSLRRREVQGKAIWEAIL